MRKFLLILITGLIAAVTFAASAWAALPLPVLRDPPDFQRFEPETPGLRIKRNREQVEEFKRVPAPEEPKREPAPEKTPEGGKKNEK